MMIVGILSRCTTNKEPEASPASSPSYHYIKARYVEVVVPPTAGVLEEAEAVAFGTVVLHCFVTSGFARCELLLSLFSGSRKHFCGSWMVKNVPE
jgi:hypothetical protein